MENKKFNLFKEDNRDYFGKSPIDKKFDATKIDNREYVEEFINKLGFEGLQIYNDLLKQRENFFAAGLNRAYGFAQYLGELEKTRELRKLIN